MNTPTLNLEDLANALRMSSGFASAEYLRIMCGVDARELVKAGLLKAGKIGRWLDGYWPAGKLAEIMEKPTT